MLNEKEERELAYVVKIDAIYPLPGYDRVESVAVGGWRVIVKKGQFKPGDYAIYFEIDSRVPAEEPFMFLEPKKFKIKTLKMCKSISQGLLMSIDDFTSLNKVPSWAIKLATRISNGENVEHEFLTSAIGVTYAVEEDNKRKASSIDKYKKMAQRNPSLFKRSIVRWLMKRTWGKKILFALFGNQKDKKNAWPAWVQKTDEERIENLPHMFLVKTPFIATEKLDGTSTTFTMKRGEGHLFGRKSNEFYVCSRNVVFDKPDKKCYYETNVYLEMAEKYNIEEALTSILNDNPDLEWVTLQGETYGGGIQKRDYGLTEHRFAGFNFITSKEGRWDSIKAAEFMSQYNIPWVPILNEEYILPDTIEELRAFVHSEPSTIDGIIKEGIVFRSQDGVISFKCVDPEFLLKYHC